jgi:DnaJ-class molecular chaperone
MRTLHAYIWLHTGVWVLRVQVKAQVPGKQQAINIMLAIEVEPHPQFSRRGHDIIYPLTLRLSEALTGK